MISSIQLPYVCSCTFYMLTELYNVAWFAYHAINSILSLWPWPACTFIRTNTVMTGWVFQSSRGLTEEVTVCIRLHVLLFIEIGVAITNWSMMLAVGPWSARKSLQTGHGRTGAVTVSVRLQFCMLIEFLQRFLSLYDAVTVTLTSLRSCADWWWFHRHFLRFL